MIHFLVYILIYPFIVIASILPFRALYLFSDLLFIVLYRIIGYRKKVVLKNLNIAFPEKSQQEIQLIMKKFYHHFLDIFIEMIKTFSISNTEIQKRFKLTNPEALSEFLSKHDKVLLVSSHYANFEWLFSLNLQMQHQGFGVYKKLKNKYINNYIVRSRSRFNTTLVPTKELIELVDSNDGKKDRCIYGLLGDQSPKLHRTHHWGLFFGVEVPVITGTEMLAKKYNYPVIYIETTKVKRGFYETKMEVLTEHPTDIPDFGITDLYMKKLETKIRKAPEYYFWTHKRFKYMRTPID